MVMRDVAALSVICSDISEVLHCGGLPSGTKTIMDGILAVVAEAKREPCSTAWYGCAPSLGQSALSRYKRGSALSVQSGRFDGADLRFTNPRARKAGTTRPVAEVVGSMVAWSVSRGTRLSSSRPKGRALAAQYRPCHSRLEDCHSMRSRQLAKVSFYSES